LEYLIEGGRSEDVRMQSMVGRIFLGRYQILRLLGEGGMGRVYLARQLDLGRQVVVKVMHDHLAEDPEFCERFQRETLLMARFQHPYAVTLYDASLNDPQGPCIIMEYIRGVTLAILLQNNRGRLTPTRIGRLLGQLCEVLHAAHQEGIVHRDLKPANLMVVDPDTPYEKIKVMDFGLAQLVGTPTLKQINGTPMDFASGTPAYISPEQVRGQVVDHRCDLYSVGVVLYELLSGRTPFGDRSSMEILLGHATEEPPPFADVVKGFQVSPAIEAVVFRCLSKDPEQRPASARELAECYDAALYQHEADSDKRMLADPSTVTPLPAALDLPECQDPNIAGYELEAWMPETIALHKLCGFMHDVGGQVVESLPGLVRVRLGGVGTAYHYRAGSFSWFGLGRKAGKIEMVLYLEPTDGERHNHLTIRVFMRSLDGGTAVDPAWRAYVDQIFCDLRGYLIAQTGAGKALHHD
jgi:serine/threonine-protein kinase